MCSILTLLLYSTILCSVPTAIAASLPIPQPWLQQRSAKTRRCLPQLLCIGTQKGGTTSWHDYLLDGYHPRLHVPKAHKELHFFDWYVPLVDKHTRIYEHSVRAQVCGAQRHRAAVLCAFPPDSPR